MIRGAPRWALLAGLAGVSGAAAQKYEPNSDIWKFRVPKGGVHAEFGGEDVMSVIASKHIKTDCSVNVIKSGHVYCLTAADSQIISNYLPKVNLAKARG